MFCMFLDNAQQQRGSQLIVGPLGLTNSLHLHNVWLAMLWCLSDRPTDAESHIWYYAAQPKQILHDKLDQESLSEYV